MARAAAAGVRHDLARAIRLAPVWHGLVGTVLLALGSLSPAYLPQASPYWGPMRAACAGLVAAGLASPADLDGMETFTTVDAALDRLATFPIGAARV